MRILDKSRRSAGRAWLTDNTVRCDYVYAYPPRQAYRDLSPSFDVQSAFRSSVQHDQRVNVYIHFPFCRQICSFCNLYATAGGEPEALERYARLLQAEIALRAPSLSGAIVRSVYLGGGTPSLFGSDLLQAVLDTLEGCLDFDLSNVPEVAIEVAPDTASQAYLRQLREIGITRINLGLQTSSESELRSIGRRYDIATNEAAIEAALDAGFDNLCVDLIYGLPGQTEEDWMTSLHWVIARRPETICAYPLTLRAGTRYGMHESQIDPQRQYHRYDLADFELQGSGYERETHVRWVIPGRGGYKQKQYHWACENVIGFGAGARSYLWHADLRNGYSLKPRKSALRQYEYRLQDGIDPVIDGFLMNHYERVRKAAILGLIDLDDTLYQEKYGSSFRKLFTSEVETLEELDLIEHSDPNNYRLTDRGVRHRDVIVQMFFSEPGHGAGSRVQL